MFENLTKFVKDGNPIKVFLSGAKLRVVRSCEQYPDRAKVYGESAYLSEALDKANLSVINPVEYKTEYLCGSAGFENRLDKLLSHGTVIFGRTDDGKIMMHSQNLELDGIVINVYGDDIEEIIDKFNRLIL